MQATVNQPVRARLCGELAAQGRQHFAPENDPDPIRLQHSAHRPVHNATVAMRACAKLGQGFPDTLVDRRSP